MKTLSRLLVSLLIILPLSSWADSGSSRYSAPLTPVQGEVTSVKPLIGDKPLYIKFWATWCKPCMEQMPHFQHIQETLGDRINIVAVNIDLNETQADIRQVIERFGLTMPLSRDHTGELARALGMQGTPYSVLINTSGDVVHTGHKADDALDRKLAILARTADGSLPALTIRGSNEDVALPEKGTAVLFFSATWCDWYLADTRPDVAKQCEAGQQWFADTTMAKDVTVRHIVNHLWTDEAAVKEYAQKYGFAHDIVIDENGDSFFAFNVREVPTLIIVKDGKIVARSHAPETFQSMISSLNSRM